MAPVFQTPVIRVDPETPDEAILERAASMLRGGGLVVFPTETVYGLGANALDPQAVAKIFQAKGRPPNNPVIVHIGAVGDVESVAADWPNAASQLAAIQNPPWSSPSRRRNTAASSG